MFFYMYKKKKIESGVEQEARGAYSITGGKRLYSTQRKDFLR